MRIYLIRTLQPHWSVHTGIHQLLRHLNTEVLDIDEHVLDRRPRHHGLMQWLYRQLSKLVRFDGPISYGLGDLQAEWTCIRQYRQQAYDILFYLDGEHTMNFAPRYFSRTRKRAAAPQIVAMLHQPPAMLQKLINGRLLTYLDHCIVLTQYQADYLATFLPSEKISVVRHGVDRSYFTPAERDDKNGFDCLSVGSWMRDYQAVFEVAERLQQHRDIRFHVVTSNIDVPKGLTNITVHRGIPDSDLLRLYQQSDLLFMPLIDATANNVLLEALACGLPIMTSKIPGTEEYLGDTASLLVGSRSIDQYVENILKLHANPELLSGMRDDALTKSAVYSWKVIGRRLESVLGMLR
jgi:glycosyltransferase involved in cell wall biosynthesis